MSKIKTKGCKLAKLTAQEKLDKNKVDKICTKCKEDHDAAT